MSAKKFAGNAGSNVLQGAVAGLVALGAYKGGEAVVDMLRKKKMQNQLEAELTLNPSNMIDSMAGTEAEQYLEYEKALLGGQAPYQVQMENLV